MTTTNQTITSLLELEKAIADSPLQNTIIPSLEFNPSLPILQDKRIIEFIKRNLNEKKESADNINSSLFLLNTKGAVGDFYEIMSMIDTKHLQEFIRAQDAKFISQCNHSLLFCIMTRNEISYEVFDALFSLLCTSSNSQVDNQKDIHPVGVLEQTLINFPYGSYIAKILLFSSKHKPQLDILHKCLDHQMYVCEINRMKRGILHDIIFQADKIKQACGFESKVAEEKIISLCKKILCAGANPLISLYVEQNSVNAQPGNAQPANENNAQPYEMCNLLNIMARGILPEWLDPLFPSLCEMGAGLIKPERRRGELLDLDEKSLKNRYDFELEKIAEKDVEKRARLKEIYQKLSRQQSKLNNKLQKISEKLKKNDENMSDVFEIKFNAKWIVLAAIDQSNKKRIWIYTLEDLEKILSGASKDIVFVDDKRITEYVANAEDEDLCPGVKDLFRKYRNIAPALSSKERNERQYLVFKEALLKNLSSNASNAGYERKGYNESLIQEDLRVCPAWIQDNFFDILEIFAKKQAESEFFLLFRQMKEVFNKKGLEFSDFISRHINTLTTQCQRYLLFACLCHQEFNLFKIFKQITNAFHSEMTTGPLNDSSLTFLIKSLNNADKRNINFKAANEFIQFLIDCGINPNYQDTQGNCAILLAAQAKMIEIIEYLVQAGVNLYLENKEGMNILNLVINRIPDSIPRLLPLLMEYGAGFICSEKRIQHNPVTLQQLKDQQTQDKLKNTIERLLSFADQSRNVTFVGNELIVASHSSMQPNPAVSGKSITFTSFFVDADFLLFARYKTMDKSSPLDPNKQHHFHYSPIFSYSALEVLIERELMLEHMPKAAKNENENENEDLYCPALPYIIKNIATADNSLIRKRVKQAFASICEKFTDALPMLNDNLHGLIWSYYSNKVPFTLPSTQAMTLSLESSDELERSNEISTNSLIRQFLKFTLYKPYQAYKDLVDKKEINDDDSFQLLILINRGLLMHDLLRPNWAESLAGMAVQNNKVKLLECLIKMGADAIEPNQPQRHSQLIAAVGREFIDCARIIIQYSNCIEILIQQCLENILPYSYSKSIKIECIKALLPKLGNISNNSVKIRFFEILYWIINQDEEDSLVELLNLVVQSGFRAYVHHFVNVQYQYSDYDHSRYNRFYNYHNYGTPLIHTLVQQKYRFSSVFIEHGLFVKDAQINANSSPLLIAINQQSSKMVQTLIKSRCGLSIYKNGQGLVKQMVCKANFEQSFINIAIQLLNAFEEEDALFVMEWAAPFILSKDENDQHLVQLKNYFKNGLLDRGLKKSHASLLYQHLLIAAANGKGFLSILLFPYYVL